MPLVNSPKLMNFIKVYKIIIIMFMTKKKKNTGTLNSYKFLQSSQFLTSTVVRIRTKMKTVHVIGALLMMSCVVGMSEGGRKVKKRK